MKKSAAKKKQQPTLDYAQYASIVFGVGILIIVIATLLRALPNTPLGQTAMQIIIGTLIVLGLVIGALNVTSSESVSFMMATAIIILLGAQFLGLISQFFPISMSLLNTFIQLFVALLVPAAVVVALKTLFITAKDE